MPVRNFGLGELRSRKHLFMVNGDAQTGGVERIIGKLKEINVSMYKAGSSIQAASFSSSVQYNLVQPVIFQFNAGIHDIARRNTFDDHLSSLKRVKDVLLNMHPMFFPVWRTTSAVHEDVVPNIPNNPVAKVDYRNSMTSLRAQVISFASARVLSPEVRVLDGYTSSVSAPLTEHLKNDIRHFNDTVYGVWTQMLLSHCVD